MGSLDQMRRDLNRKVEQTARITASEWESRLRRESPSDTGEMRQKTTVKSRTTATGAVIEAKVDTPYAHIVSAGQRAHTIPLSGQRYILRNERTGFKAFGPVQHPGAMGRTWWADALRDVPDLLARNWNGLR